jgi:hypothetical protein
LEAAYTTESRPGKPPPVAVDAQKQAVFSLFQFIRVASGTSFVIE